MANALLCCQVCSTQFYRDLVFSEVSEETRRTTALRFEAWRALGAPWGNNSRPFVHEPDILQLLPADSPLWESSFDEIQAVGHDGLTHDFFADGVRQRAANRKKAAQKNSASSPSVTPTSPKFLFDSANIPKPDSAFSSSFLQLNGQNRRQRQKKGESSKKAGGGADKSGGPNADKSLSDASNMESPRVIDPPTKHALLAPCCKLCRGDFEGMKPPSTFNEGNPFPPPPRRTESASGEGYQGKSFLEMSSGALSLSSTKSQKRQHRRQRLRLPNEVHNEVISSAPIKSKMQKIKKTKTFVNLAKIKAQMHVALNYPHCCPICPASRFPTMDYGDIRDVPTHTPLSFVQLEFRSRLKGFVGAVGAAAAGPLGAMINGAMGASMCPKGGGCVMCPNPRTNMPPFGEPWSVNDESANDMAMFAARQQNNYHIEGLMTSLDGDAKADKIMTDDVSGINCQEGLPRNFRNKRPCKAVLSIAESREAKLNLGDSGPGE